MNIIRTYDLTKKKFAIEKLEKYTINCFYKYK